MLLLIDTYVNRGKYNPCVTGKWTPVIVGKPEVYLNHINIQFLPYRRRYLNCQGRVLNVVSENIRSNFLSFVKTRTPIAGEKVSLRDV